MSDVISVERVERAIIFIRDQRVILDRDLAALYGVETKVLNQAVSRNEARFPRDFAFKLNKREKLKLVTDCDQFKSLKHSYARPRAFTEHGAIMAANVLNTPEAIEMSVFVVRAFVKLRQILASHADLAAKLEELETKYDGQFQVVFEAIRQLMEPPEDGPNVADIALEFEDIQDTCFHVGTGARNGAFHYPSSLFTSLTDPGECGAGPQSPTWYSERHSPGSAIAAPWQRIGHPRT